MGTLWARPVKINSREVCSRLFVDLLRIILLIAVRVISLTGCLILLGSIGLLSRIGVVVLLRSIALSRIAVSGCGSIFLLIRAEQEDTAQQAAKQKYANAYSR